MMKESTGSENQAISMPPRVHVHRVRNAGHLLMLDNHDKFNAAVIIAGGGKHKLPEKLPEAG